MEVPPHSRPTHTPASTMERHLNTKGSGERCESEGDGGATPQQTEHTPVEGHLSPVKDKTKSELGVCYSSRSLGKGGLGCSTRRAGGGVRVLLTGRVVGGKVACVALARKVGGASNGSRSGRCASQLTGKVKGSVKAKGLVCTSLTDRVTDRVGSVNGTHGEGVRLWSRAQRVGECVPLTGTADASQPRR